MRVPTFTLADQPDKTFILAVAAAALVAAGELLALGLHYAGRAWSAAPAATAPIVATTPAATAAPSIAPAAAPLATPGATPSNAALSVGEDLLKEAILLRERGDTTNALARLQDAIERDPKNASALAEMAMIYESMQLLERSNEAWQKIQEIGPAAGALYELADMKLKTGVAPPVGSAAAAGPGFAGVSPLDAGTARNPAEGIPDNSTFGITETAVTENPDEDAETNLTLRVAVKVRSNSVIDHTKVKIQVYFYDTVENNKVALTDAEVSYEWLTPNHDWKDTNPEILAVGYIRLKSGALSTEAALAAAAAAVNPSIPGRKTPATPKKPPTAASGNRKYAGYQVRVYYSDQLQDVRAEPKTLLNLYPPPLTLSTP